MLLFIATGLDDYSAFGATAATLNNLGPGLGEVASNFTTVSDSGKWIAILAMVFGRLEIFTLVGAIHPGVLETLGGSSELQLKPAAQARNSSPQLKPTSCSCND